MPPDHVGDFVPLAAAGHPRRGAPGPARQPRWPGIAYPDGDYYLYLTADLRLGTFGHPWEDSLCVFGDELLTEVEEDLTALLGTVMRRAGRNIGTTWSFGPGTP